MAQWLVDALPVCVAVHQQNLTRKSQGFRAQGLQQIPVTGVRQAGRVMLEAWVGLHDDDHAGRLFAPCNGKSLSEPVDEHGIARQIFVAGRAPQAEMVVRTGNVERQEQTGTAPGQDASAGARGY